MKHLFTLLALFSFSLFAQTVPNYVPTNGLVGWWPLDGNSNDFSGNNFNASSLGVTYTSGHFNVPNTGASLDGNSYFEVPHNPGLISNTHTISLWYKSNFATLQTIAGKHDHGTAANEMFVLQIDPSNGSSLTYSVKQNSFCNAGSGWITIASNSIPSLNNFHHLVLMSDATILKFYVDGVLKSTLPRSPAPLDNCSSSMWFGRDYATNQLYNFKGILDDIGIWNRALTATEIQTLYFGCTDTLSAQPVSVNASLGSTATFTAASSASGANYQWQGKSGNSFVNLSNAGQFSGSTTGTLTVSGVTSANNGSEFRCIVDHGDCADTSNVATLTACFDVTNQPFDRYVVAGTSTTFGLTTNDPSNCTYQWQTNAGFGFQNISNAGQYSGTTSNTLSVASVSAANNNQLFRCLITSGTCKDTTSEAKIILSGVGVNESRLDALTLSPNPTSGTIRFNLPVSGTYRISAPDGRVVDTGEMKEILDLSRFPNGVYTIEVQFAQAQRTFRAVRQD